MLALSNDTQWILPLSIFVAGLIGSPHCLAMCGPLAANFAKTKKQMASYQAGRLFSYVLLGVAFGAFGKKIFGTDRPDWLSLASLSLLAILLVTNGVRAFLGRPLHFPMPSILQNFLNRIWGKIPALKLRPMTFSGLSGALTIFLPCGHLYSFVLGAMATGSAVAGAGFMFAFWLGSTPLITIGSHWLQKALHTKTKSRQRWAGALLVAAGLFSVLAFGLRAENFNDRIHPQNSLTAPGSPGMLTCH